MRTVLSIVVEKIKTPFYVQYIFSENRAVYENVQKYGPVRDGADINIIWRMRFACWLIKATDTHEEFVILIAFPQQQCLQDCTPILPL
jgi:hypothetical protein